MDRRKTIVLGLLVVALASISVDASAASRALVNANARGNRAQDAGKYESALQSYGKALKLAEEADDGQYRAMAMYGLARANAQLCRATQAEKWFRESIALRESILDDPKLAFLTQNLIEFARFLLSIGRTEEAAAYFGRAIPMLEDMDVERIDPIGYAHLLDDFVAVLEKIGKIEDSKVHARRAAELREKNPGRPAGFTPVPYPVDCAPEPE